MKYLYPIILILIITACTDEKNIIPVDIKYGQDLCAACSMIISESLYSGQYISTYGKVKKFDDIGCMIEHIKSTKGELDKIRAVFIRDFKTDNWINAKSAHFLKSKYIITPMGHGIIGFANLEYLKEHQFKSAGKNLGSLLDLINN